MPFDGSIQLRVGLVSAGHTAAQSAVVLDMIEFFFDGGRKWARRTLETNDGKRCLLGSIQYVQREIGYSDDRAVEYLARAINIRQMRKGLPALGDSDSGSVMGFNDTYRRQFGDILDVVRQARELALLDAFVSSMEAGPCHSLRSSKQMILRDGVKLIS